MSAKDVSVLDGKCVMAMLLGAVRAERFCDGALLGFFKKGCIKILNTLLMPFAK